MFSSMSVLGQNQSIHQTQTSNSVQLRKVFRISSEYYIKLYYRIIFTAHLRHVDAAGRL